MRRKFFILMLLISVANLSQAQFKSEAPRNLPHYDDVFWQWGYYFGLTYFNFKTRYTVPKQEITVISEPGFNVGLISDFRLTRMLSFRTEPGLYFTRRKLIFNYLPDQYDKVRIVTSNYILVPALLKLNAIRNGNMRPYITGGIIWGHNLSSFENSINDNSNGVFRMKRQSWFWSVGVGFEMYLYYFKLTPSLRGIFALSNEYVPDTDPNSPWTRHLEYVGTRGIYFTLTFE